ncbi:MAG: nuclear transport factor 2 family protein [Myxococcales bacterium]|nr:nuclear transport factor 2 family protein [Myxococcota bacterium]MDW8283463.1 nuclear transport factor 2 family protein [Myxococcales bacterium]
MIAYWLILLLTLAGACQRLALAQAQPAQTPPPLAGAPARPMLSEAEVRALLDRWLAAQNQGRFDLYQALYASRFYGVRRSGSRTVHLDRAGWLRDRARMFGKPMQVEVADLTVHPGSSSAQVRFTQSWASGSYRDVGPKVMVIVREAGGLRIAREELLRSERLAPPAPGGLLWVLEGEAVLARQLPEEASWFRGPPVLIAARSGYAAVRDLDVTRLPQEHRAGPRLRLVTPRGQSCLATLGPLRVRSWVRPHFGEVQTWQGQSADNPHPWPQGRIAAAVWSLGERLLLARLQAEGCQDALLALPEQAPAPLVVPGKEADAALRKVVLGALSKLAAYARIQQRFAAATLSQPRTARWEDYRSAAPPQVHLYEHPRASLVYVSHQAGEPPQGCGDETDFYGALSVLFELQGGRPILRSDPDTPVERPLVALDVEGDGQVELLTAQELLRRQGEVYRPALAAPVMPDHDCPC